MDRDTRNLLANTTQALRRGLEEEFALQLGGRFDVLRDGSIADAPGPQLDDAEKFTRRKIVETIQHRRASGESDEEAGTTTRVDREIISYRSRWNFQTIRSARTLGNDPLFRPLRGD